jgi:inner membrane protein
MDNVTHGLIGYALGRATTRTRSAAEQRAGIWASIAASNAPDLDFIASLVSNHAKLSYLGHHRGHTHTLLLAVPIGIACAELCLRLFRVSDAGARMRLYALGALAGLLHIAFDWLNNYGVHPFFPLDNRWYYGDAVFIIEPLFFAALLPLLALDGLTRFGRGVGLFLCAAILALVWGISLMPTASAVVATLALGAALLLHVVARKLNPKGIAWHALGATVAAVLLFAGGRALALGGFTRYLAVHAHGERIEQLVLTPLPAHPICWTAIAVTTDPAGTYRGRFGYASLLPSLIDPETCRFAPRGQTTAPLARTDLPLERGIAFKVAFEGKLDDLRALAQKSCETRKLLQFARAPYWIDGPPTIVGDLRYDHEPELQFAELEPNDACSDGPVPWNPPLQSLLR